ncbi:platelet-derived growth factor receptor-like protein isoform X2 [Rhineura floridana]|uniref:platelet-derived growth factor receptor-like protein isoform X2 n=1 Tax=Rhineura floridana TaxID=261503 RepID=UPI002AC829D7|nr:platelet-derived growth factor receptor-like protein isoform X2 [Rhineura floridana]
MSTRKALQSYREGHEGAKSQGAQTFQRVRIKHFERHSQLTVVNSTAADTDPQELFVPTEDYYKVIQLRTNHPARLPCQVTNPLAKVTLHRQFPPKKVVVDGIDISYDVKKGFVIHRPQLSHAGFLFCMASVGGMRQISTKYMLIYVNYPPSVPRPAIRASVASFQVGDTFNVTCTVFGEPEIAVDFTWEYPGQQKSEQRLM